MVNSFICYSPYSTLDYKKSVSRLSQACLLKCVKAMTSMFIKVCQVYHNHYDK